MMTDRQAIVYDEVSLLRLPGLLWRVARGFEVFTLRVPASSKQPKWLALLLQRGYLKPLKLLSWPYRVYNPSVDMAFETVEREYESRWSNNALIASVVHLYEGDKRIHLGFKKTWSEQLQRQYELEQWCDAIGQTLGERVRWAFVPLCPEYGLHALGDAQLVDRLTLLSRLRGWTRMQWARVLHGGLALRSVMLGLMALLRWRNGGCAQRVNLEFGVAIVSPIREFAYGIRGLEFILDGEGIRKDNVMFVPLVPLNNSHRAELHRRGLTLAQENIPPTWKDLWGGICLAGRLCASLMSGELWISRAAAYLLREHLTWSGFLARYRLKNFISYADYSVRHVGRSCAMSKAGVKTWYYADAEFTYETMPGPHHRDIGFGYMMFDHCVSWSNRYTRYMQRHFHCVGQYSEVGCLWSEQVILIKKGQLQSSFPDKLAAAGFRSGMRVIAAFDAFFHNDGWLPIRDGVAFAEGMLRLLIGRDDLFLIFKEKKWPELYAREGSDELRSIYRKLANHPRCLVPGFEVPTPEVLAHCDLCISFPYGSPAVEALGARVKALYFAPDKRYSGGYYDRVPGLVVYEEPALRRRVDELLDGTPDSQYHTHLETYVKGDIDPYLDGQGLTRFRRLLCGRDLSA